MSGTRRGVRLAPERLVAAFATERLLAQPFVLVAVDGGTGSGKTTLARRLQNALAGGGIECAVVHLDHFFRTQRERGSRLARVEDTDWRRLRDEVILPLRAGRSARFQLYDWPQDRLRRWQTVPPAGVLIVDGVSSLRRELAHYYDLAIWLACPREKRIARLAGRGDTPPEEIECWLPSEDAYLVAHAPRQRAHLVVDARADAAAADAGLETERWSPPAAAGYRMRQS